MLATLSNGGMALLVNLARAAGLPFDCILSTELVKSYKPDPRTYQLVPSLLAWLALGAGPVRYVYCPPFCT